VQLSIQIQVAVSGLPAHSVLQRAIWSAVYASVQEGKVAMWLSLHGELDAGLDVIEMVKEVIHLF